MTDKSKEREIMMVMRKVLTSIVKETTPPPGQRHPLSEKTITDVRMCLGLITARERELADIAGIARERPYFTDEPPSEKVVPLQSIGKSDKKPDRD